MSDGLEYSGEEFSRDTVWVSYDGHKRAIKELEDNHILNLLNYMGRRVKRAIDLLADTNQVKEESLYQYLLRKLSSNKSLLKVINEEIDLRGLGRKLVEGGKSLPFKKDGRWMIWKEGEPRPTPIPNSIDFIKPLDGNG